MVDLDQNKRRMKTENKRPLCSSNINKMVFLLTDFLTEKCTCITQYYISAESSVETTDKNSKAKND